MNSKVFHLPVRELIVNRVQTAQFEDGDTPRVLVDWNQGIDIQVEWDGRDESPGSFQALASGNWTPLANIAPGTQNDQIVTEEQPVTKVRVSRGDLHPGVRFAAKIIPVTWSNAPSFAEHELVVVRGTHYAYAGSSTPETVPWVDSALQAGVHRLVLDDIVVGQDYEMWIRLWHPTNPDEFKDQDPIVRTDPSGTGNPN